MDACCFFSNAQLQIGTGTNWKSEAGVYAVLDSMSLKHDATSASLDNVFKFTGNTNVSISGSTLPLFTNVEVALTGTSKIVLQRTIKISQGLTFESGLFDLNINNIDLGTSGSVSGESETSRITGANGGYIQIINTLNTPSSSNPGNLGAIITSAQNLGSTTIRRGHQSQVNDGGSGSGILRYYDIIPATNSSLNATLRFSYFDAELNSLAENGLVLWRSPNNVNWTNEGFTSSNTITNYVEKTGIDAFSRWTLSPVGNALPLQFLLFNVRCSSNIVTVTWKTGNEFNTGHFEIQRTANGTNWTTVGNLPAAGNSVSGQTYFFTDNTPLSTAALYRVTEIDLDGKMHYTNIIRNDCGNMNSWKTWPNPVQEYLFVNISVQANSKAAIRIYDAKGALVKQQSNDLLAGNNQFAIDMRHLPPGTYNVVAKWSNGQTGKTFMVIKQ